MDDLLLSTNTTMSQISNNFEDYMRQSILNLVKSHYLTSALEGWYDQFAKDLSDNTLSETEVEQLKKDYTDIFTNAQKQVDDLLHVADITKSDTNPNTIKSSVQSMSEGTADVLTAQFTSIRVNVADMLNVQKEFNASFDTVKTDISILFMATIIGQPLAFA